MRYLHDDPEIEFIRECSLVSRKWRARLNERLKPSGITLSRATLLYWLERTPGPVSQCELADLIGIRGPTLARQLHALEVQGLIERGTAPHDRRANAVRLTQKAHSALEKVQKVIRSNADEFFSSLDKRGLLSTTKLLRQARAALSERA